MDEQGSKPNFVVGGPIKKGGRPKKLSIGASWREYSPNDLKKFIQAVEKSKICWSSSNLGTYVRLYSGKRMLAFDMIEMKCSWFMRRNRGKHARKLWDELVTDYHKEERKQPEDKEKSFPYSEMSFLKDEIVKIDSDFPNLSELGVGIAPNDELAEETRTENLEAVVDTMSVSLSVERKFAENRDIKANDETLRKKPCPIPTAEVPSTSSPYPIAQSSEESSEYKPVFDLIASFLNRCSEIDRMKLKAQIINFVIGKMSKTLPVKAIKPKKMTTPQS